MPVSTFDPSMMSMSPFGEVMYGTVGGGNRDSQLELPGTYGFGLVRYGLMFCSSPAGRAPEVTGPYCSQTRSGALPPEAWLSSWALDWVMLDMLFGSHWTVTFLCAASYCGGQLLQAGVVGRGDRAGVRRQHRLDRDRGAAARAA